MNPTDLNALAERIEALAGPDREIDLAVHKAIGRAPADAVWSTEEAERLAELAAGLIPFPSDKWETPAYRDQRHEREKLRRASLDMGAAAWVAFHNENPLPEYDWEKAPPLGWVPAWTASVDAALRLIPAGWRVEHLIQHNHDARGQPWAMWLVRRTAPYMQESSHAVTPSLATLAASLRAIAYDKSSGSEAESQKEGVTEARTVGGSDVPAT